MAGKNVLEFNQENWQKEVLESTVPVVVDFWAVWCGPCRMIAPYIDRLADEYAGKIKVGKVNIDDSQELATQYRVSGIPLVLVLKGGEVKEQLPGAQPEKMYKAAVERTLTA